MDAETIAALSVHLEENSDGLWPCHIEVAEAFLAASTQWRVVATLSGLFFVGLDYAGVKVALDAAGIAVTPVLWSDLQVMEGEARAELNRSDG